MHDPNEYDEFGKPIYKRGLRQNNDYHRNVVGQCVFWYKRDRAKNNKPVNLSEKQLAEYFHNKFKKYVLPIFGEVSTTKLTTEQMPEYIAECILYLAEEFKLDSSQEKGIDFTEHGFL